MHESPQQTVWRVTTYNLGTRDSSWAPYRFSIGPVEDGRVLGAIEGDIEAGEYPEHRVAGNLSKAEAVIYLIDEMIMPTIGEWDWHCPEFYEAFALRVSRDPQTQFVAEQYAGESARLPASPDYFSPIEPEQTVTASFSLSADDADDLEVLLRRRRGDDFVDGVLCDRYFPPLKP